MNLFKKIKNIFVGFENLISTEHSCISCGREILDGTKYQLCKKCEDKIDKIDGNTCFKCGEKLYGENLLCDYCKNFDYKFDENKSICYYAEVSASIIKSLKYGGKKYFAKHIAEFMCEDKDYFGGVDYITFVPMSKKNKRARGFNQAEEIAVEISKLMNIPVIKFIDKVKEHKHQAGLNQKQRLENLKGTFEIFEENSKEIKGKVVLIVDDVFTTGATLSECSKILKTKKPAKVKTITFAKTKLNSIN